MKPEDINTAIARLFGICGRIVSCYSPLTGKQELAVWDNPLLEPHYVRDYATDNNAAITLCDKLTEEGWVCRLDNGLDKTWECVFYKPVDEKTPTHYGAAATLSGAICESFLRVKGLWDDGDSSN